MTPTHRNVLLEANFALEHLVWSYRAEIDRSPSHMLTADDICVHDFASRTAALVRGVLDEANGKRAPRLAFRPPSIDAERRLAAALQARRLALAEAAIKRAGPTSSAPTETASEAAPTDSDAIESEHLDNDEPVSENDLFTGTRIRDRRRPR